MFKLEEVVLIDGFLGDVCQFNFDILGALHGCPKVEILDIKSAELGPWTRENTVNDKFDKFEGCSGGSYFPWEYYTIACNGNPCAILILLLGFYFAYYPGVANFFLSGLGDIT